MQSNSTAIAQKAPSPISNLSALVESKQKQLKQIAAESCDIKKLYRAVIGCMVQNNELMKCTTSSLFNCMQQAAELGLTFGSALGECYMVPYKETATFIIGYRGLIVLARNSGEVSDVQVGAVYEGDELEYEKGLNPKLRHVEHWKTNDPDKLTHAYVIFYLNNGRAQWDIMPRIDIERIKASSPGAGNKKSPWQTSYREMAIKTVIRRACKLLPMSVEKVMAKVDSYEAGAAQLPPAPQMKSIASAPDEPRQIEEYDEPESEPASTGTGTSTYQMTPEEIRQIEEEERLEAAKYEAQLREEDEPPQSLADFGKPTPSQPTLGAMMR